MQVSWITRIVFTFFGLLLIFSAVPLQAVDLNLSMQEIETDGIVQVPKQMTQKEMNDLFGEDPYLGQTSYLQSPDGFSQRKKSK